MLQAALQQQPRQNVGHNLFEETRPRFQSPIASASQAVKFNKVYLPQEVLLVSISRRGPRVVPSMSTDVVLFLERSCPHIWALFNQQARRNPPKGFQEFLSGTGALEGRRQLQLADTRISRLIAKTCERRVGDAYRRDLSGVNTENKLAELLCEITLIDALGGISSAPPVLRPKTETGKACDVKVVVESGDLYGESKRLADTWEGGARSIAKSSPESKPSGAARPRAMDLFSKLKDVHTQFPRGTLNVLFLFHPSVWNTPVYIKQALFGDASGFDESSSQPPLHDDGLYALSEWQELSACALARVNNDGTLSIVQIWRNPRAGVPLSDSLADKLALAG